MNEYRNRQSKLLELIGDTADGALITSQVNRLYFTGYDADTGFLLVTKGGCAFVTDFRYTEAAEAATNGVCECITYRKFGETMQELIGKFGAKSLLFETERLTIAEGVNLADAIYPAEAMKTDALDRLIDSMRISKTQSELDMICAAQAVTEQCFMRVLGLVKEGVSERDLALELEFDMRRSGATRVAFDLIVAAGANGSMPHAVPSDNRVKKGDFITFDIGAVVGGYHSDMTRTVSLGKVSDEQMKIYETVRQAQKASIEYLVGGGDDCFTADKIARDVITDAGYGEQFGHSTGHGVGLEIHEKPRLSTAAKTKLTPGNVVTVEPGIYLEGRFGVRIEDMLYITENSAKDLTGIQRELIVL